MIAHSFDARIVNGQLVPAEPLKAFEGQEVRVTVSASVKTTSEPGPYRIEILTIEEEEGGYSTIALNLPGAGSCGDTKEQSIANAEDAIKTVLEEYKESGDRIPWAEVMADKIGPGEKKVILVHV